MSITTHCMTVSLHMGVWKGYRLDKQASADVTQRASAAGDAARVNKHLVPKDALKNVETAANAIRLHFHKHTLPWKDNGDRLLTRAMYFVFMPEHGALVHTFRQAVEEFVTTTYPSAREQAAFRMGKLFNPEDYPHPDELRQRFYVRMDTDVVTTANDFRVEIDEAHAQQIRGDIERAVESRITGAMMDVWTRIADTVGHFASKMADPNSIFRDSTVENLEELIRLLPALNVTNDPHITALHEAMLDRLTGYQPKDLRKSKASRAQAAKDAQAIMDQMSGFMAAFQGMGAAA